MAYVALSRVRSISGVHLSAFSPSSIMASRSCVKEVNRLRQDFRPDLPQYELPAGKTKRTLTGALVPILPIKPVGNDSKRYLESTADQHQSPHTIRMWNKVKGLWS